MGKAIIRKGGDALDVEEWHINTVACPHCEQEPSFFPIELKDEKFKFEQPDELDGKEFNVKIMLTEQQALKAGCSQRPFYVSSIDLDFIDDEIEEKDKSRVIEIKQFYIRVPNEATQNVFLDSLELLCNQWAQELPKGKDWSYKFDINEM